jgi:hypothetical protein
VITDPRAGLDGPSKTIVVEPAKQPAETPSPAPARPAPAPKREKVPA